MSSKSTSTRQRIMRHLGATWPMMRQHIYVIADTLDDGIGEAVSEQVFVTGAVTRRLRRLRGKNAERYATSLEVGTGAVSFAD